jgi:tRNA (guanine-N7-)-methyltransferase
MRPSDLKSPFSKNKKQTLIESGVLYLPKSSPTTDFHFPGWRDPSIFKQEAPIKIEYCSGNGDWIAARALNDPTTNWIAVEMLFDRVRKIWSKKQNFNLDNLFIVSGEGANLTRSFIQDQSVSGVFINFPDPWPKRRHAKYRIIQSEFIKELERILIPGSTFIFVTDDIDYSKQFIELMHSFPKFESIHSTPFVTEKTGYGGSYFETIWRDLGKAIRYHEFRKKI